MILNLQPYSNYKDSGVEWLGRVPEEWEVVRNKAYLRYRKQAVGESSGDYTLLSLTLKGVIKRNMDNPQGKFPAEFNTYQVVNPGDLIFCLFDMDETPRTVGLSNHYGMITGAYDVVFSINQNATNYLYLYFLSIDNIKGLKPLYSGLRKVIPKDVFMSMKIPMPSTEEQTAIVRYLNYTNSRIQQYIATKQKLIKLLEEQKQAIIHQAVTGAIDVATGNPYPKYKDSGVKWLGKVPEAWEVKKIKYLCSIHNGSDHKEIETTVGYPVIGSGGQFSYASKFVYDKESVLFGRKGTIDKPIYINEPFWTVDTMFYSKIYNNVLPKFLYFIATTIPYDYYSTKTALPSMTQTILGNHKTTLPSMEIQKAIINYVERECAIFNKTIDKAKHEIVLLKEYRTRLTADVVTGKVDVREVAKNMPAEVTKSIVDDPNNDDAEDNEMLKAIIEE